jgi:hypothetical protein
MFRPMLLPPDFVRAAVAGFHDAGAAAGDDVDLLVERLARARGDQARRSGAPPRSSGDIDDRHLARAPGPGRRLRPRPAPAAAAPRRAAAARALPKMTTVARMPCSLLDQLGLEQLELHAHRTQFLAQQEALSVKARR